LGKIRNGKVVIQDAVCASRKKPAAEIAVNWANTLPRVLFALDAPLGWPEALSQELRDHVAGAGLEVPAHVMFRRETDNEIYRRLRKRPFDVGSNLIARTAHAALALLREIGRELNQRIPLAWRADWEEKYAAIEVYPAATRLAFGATRGTRPLEGLDELFEFGVAPLPASPHAQDAILCVLAGADFLRGDAVGPSEAQMDRARREGWIWARAPTNSMTP
jgi:hypothetical protein